MGNLSSTLAKLHLRREGSSQKKKKNDRSPTSTEPSKPDHGDPDDLLRITSGSASMRRRPSKFLSDPLEQSSSRLFRDLPANICPGCREPLSGAYNFVSAAGKTWHPGCYKCAECGVGMKPSDGFVLSKGRVLHEVCNAKLNGEVCVGCDQALMPNEEYVRALGKAFHMDHFTCFECNDSLAGKEKIHELDGYILCDRDYRIKTNIRCAVCKEVILEGNYLFAGNRYFHPEHFKCGECKVVIPEGGNYYAHKGRPCCEKCIRNVKKELKIESLAAEAAPMPIALQVAEQAAG